MNYWIFQGNPKHMNEDGTYFDVTNEILNNDMIKWGVRQHHYVNVIKSGDVVFIWRSDGYDKGSGGIIATGIAISDVYNYSDQNKDLDYVVEVKLLSKKVTTEAGMILRSALAKDIELSNLTILKQPTGTNYKLSKEDADNLMAVWDGKRPIIEATTENKIKYYLEQFKPKAKDWFENVTVVKEYYDFYQNFIQPENLQHLKWEDIQNLGDHIHALSRNALARKRAFGVNNKSIEHYQNALIYLVEGADELKIRINHFLSNDEYRIPFLGKSSVSEIVGNIFPDQLCLYNKRDIVALQQILGINLELNDDDTFADELFKYTEKIDEIKLKDYYLQIIGKQTNLPLNLEIDQFFSFLYENYSPEAERRYWSISVGENASMWDDFMAQGVVGLMWDELGDLSKYRNKKQISQKLKEVRDIDFDPKNDTLANFQFANEMRVGDFLIAKQGTRTVLGFGEVESDYIFDEARQSYKSIRRVNWMQTGEWKTPEDAKFATKALTDITEFPKFIDQIMTTMLGEEIQIKPHVKDEPKYETYSQDDFLNEVFIDQSTYEKFTYNLNHKKNIILQGPPGVGKTYIAKRLAYAHSGIKSQDFIQMVQFHQSYSYEDFIRGYKPNKDGNFTLTDGVFYKFCLKAAQDLDHNYYFIIDEINRGNMSKIFGELLMLIEADKRGEDFAIPLTYTEDENDTFYIPENVYIIGMMNTADRSLALVDYALRRRFAFIDIEPAFEQDKYINYLQERISETLANKIMTQMNKLNQEIRNDTLNLGRGYQIGHSFFTPNKEHVDDEAAWYENIIRMEIEPLLREYWFDDLEKVAKLIDDLQ